MIEPYSVAVIQAEKIVTRSGGDQNIRANIEKNLERYCGLIDFACGGPFAGKKGFNITNRVKLVTFGEYAITGLHHAAETGQQSLPKKEIIDKIAIRIPGTETDVLAEKAKQWQVYIAASNLEHDPEWPDFFFNSGFIINPEGKVVLKYRKTVTNVAVAMHCSVHDVMDVYKNPLTGKYDPFPVVDTEIGRLAIFICVDLKAPEIPRVYSMKGADVVLHLTSGMSASDGRNVPMGVIEAALKTRAWDNAVYLVNSNWGPELGAYYPRARIAGWSNVFDYMGNELIRADHPNEQIITATIDIEACRKFREGYFRNPISLIRTELYAPYYSQPIYPSNTFLRDGPIEELLNEQQLGYFKQAMGNVKKLQDFYSEKEI